jgi:hypothetical protein
MLHDLDVNKPLEVRLSYLLAVLTIPTFRLLTKTECSIVNPDVLLGASRVHLFSTNSKKPKVSYYFENIITIHDKLIN